MERAGWGGVGGKWGEEGEEKTLGAQARQAMPTSALFRADADIGDEIFLPRRKAIQGLGKPVICKKTKGTGQRALPGLCQLDSAQTTTFGKENSKYSPAHPGWSGRDSPGLVFR